MGYALGRAGLLAVGLGVCLLLPNKVFSRGSINSTNYSYVYGKSHSGDGVGGRWMIRTPSKVFLSEEVVEHVAHTDLM